MLKKQQALYTFFILLPLLTSMHVANADENNYINAIISDTNTDSFQEANNIKGQLQPTHHTVISSELSGNIITINVKESDRFKHNSTLVTFKCDIEKAELKKARAAHKADKSRITINSKLEELSSISQLDYKLSKYKAEESAADVELLSKKVESCHIKAPYAGVVEEVIKQPHEFVNRGDPVLKILDDSTLEIELLVPSNWITWLKKNSTFNVHISELDISRKATISAIGAKIDPVSQSIKIKGSISNKDKLLKPGMSITADFKR